jgi:hypothetical protein
MKSKQMFTFVNKALTRVHAGRAAIPSGCSVFFDSIPVVSPLCRSTTANGSHASGMATQAPSAGD